MRSRFVLVNEAPEAVTPGAQSHANAENLLELKVLAGGGAHWRTGARRWWRYSRANSTEQENSGGDSLP